jgi:rhodanese-related sulfurtransferase
VDVAALAGEIDREADHVTAIELAEWIRDRKPGLRVLDVRADSEYAAYHIPSAEHVPLARIASLRPAGGETLVLYSEGGAHAAQAWVLLRAVGFAHVYFLRGGLLDWMEDVMNPVLAADAERVRAVSRYFGGVPRQAPAVTDSAAPRRDAATLVRQVRRRGC